MKKHILGFLILTLAIACKTTKNTVKETKSDIDDVVEEVVEMIDEGADEVVSIVKGEKASDPSKSLLQKYIPFTLSADLSHLSDNQKNIVGKLIDAAKMMDDLFWYQAYGDKDQLLNSITDDGLKQFAIINYGPYDRLDGNASFIKGIKAKPAGANFYPVDMTKEEFEASEIEDKTGLYSFIRRNDKGALYSIPYHVHFKDEVTKVSEI